MTAIYLAKINAVTNQDAVEKWDAKHRNSLDLPPISVALSAYDYLLPSKGTALDYACGLGAQALWLARNNFVVTAWDFSVVAIERLRREAAAQQLPIDAVVCDVTQTPLPTAAFDVIVVGRFLYRPAAPALMAALRPGGLLFYETFTRQKDPTIGPTNPEFLLEENELLRLFAGLTVRAYSEAGRVGDVARGLRQVAYLVAEKPTTDTADGDLKRL